MFVVREVPVVCPVRFSAAPGLAGGVAAAVRVAPVEILRIVEPELHPVLVAGFGELRRDVPTEWRRVDDVVL